MNSGMFVLKYMFVCDIIFIREIGGICILVVVKFWRIVTGRGKNFFFLGLSNVGRNGDGGRKAI